MNATANAMETKKTRPASNICEQNGTVMLRLEMPGVTKDGIEVNIEGDSLTVEGHRKDPGERTYLVRERRAGDYRATYTVDHRVDRERVEARMENGVLTIELHLKPELKPRTIKVKAG